MSGFTVGTAGPDDIDAFVASVEGLFREDGGRHDPSIDVAWPTREGAGYYAGLLDDPDCLLAVARQESDVVGHLVGKLVGPDALRRVRFAVLESMRVRPDLQWTRHWWSAGRRVRRVGEAIGSRTGERDGVRRKRRRQALLREARLRPDERHDA